MKLITFISLIIVLLSISCEKENTYSQTEDEECRVFLEKHTNEELFCNDYLIAPPGSWWEYSSGLLLETNNLKMIKTYSLEKEVLGCKYYNEDLLLAQSNPWLGAIDSLSQIRTDDGNLKTYRHPILDTALGVFYNTSFYPSAKPKRKETYLREVIAKFDSLEVNGTMYYNLIKVKHFFKADFQKGPTYYEIKYYTFAQNIGVVRYEFPFEEIDDQLTDYYIAP